MLNCQRPPTGTLLPMVNSSIYHLFAIKSTENGRQIVEKSHDTCASLSCAWLFFKVLPKLLIYKSSSLAGVPEIEGMEVAS